MIYVYTYTKRKRNWKLYTFTMCFSHPFGICILGNFSWQLLKVYTLFIILNAPHILIWF